MPSRRRIAELAVLFLIAVATLGLAVVASLIFQPITPPPDADWQRGVAALHHAVKSSELYTVNTNDEGTKIELEFENGETVIIYGLPRLAIGVGR